MNSMTLAMRFQVEADKAKAEIQETVREMQKIGPALRDAAAPGREAFGQLQGHVAETGRQMQLAGGQIGNLTAQFNDIGMMLMAGQNPLQLAIQQGTQITQVIGPMGAAGAARALGQAFMAMLSPINLITIGSIAAGAALTQWLVSSTEETLSLDDAVKDLKASIDAYAASAKAAGASSADLVAKYGMEAEAIRGLLAIMAERDRREAERKMSATADALDSELGIIAQRRESIDTVALRDLFDMSSLRDARLEIGRVLDAIAEFQNAATLDEQVQAGLRLVDVFRQAAMANGEISAEEDRLLGKMAEAVKEGQRFATEIENAPVTDLRQRVGELAADLADAAMVNLARVFTDADGPAAAILAKIGAMRDALKQAAREAGEAPIGASGAPPVDVRATGPYAPGNNTFGNPYGDPNSAPDTSPRPRTAPSSIDFGLPPVSGGGRGGRTRIDRDGFEYLQKQAEDALKALDFAVAAVNEKVRAGLMTVAEGQDAIADANTSAAGKIADLIPKIEKANDVSGPAAASAVEKWRTALKGLAADVGKVGSTVSRDLSDAFSGAFSNFIQDAARGKDAFASFANSIMDAMTRIFADRFAMQFITPMFDGMFGAMGYDAGGYTGPGGVTEPAGVVHKGEVVWSQADVARAGGVGVVEAMRLGRRGYASGGLVDWEPSVLRSPGVSLARPGSGVPAAMQGGAPQRPGQVIVNVTNTESGTVQTAVSQRSDGMDQIIDLLVERADAALASNVALGRGAHAAAMESTYGLRRQGRF